MTRVLVVMLVLLGFTTACSTGKEATKRVSFPEAEYAQLSNTGKGVVTAQVFIKTKAGEILTKAGNKVILNPVTSYSSQWYDTARRKQPLEDPDPRLLQHVREGITDRSGQVVFRNIPAGEYYLVSPLVWSDVYMATGDTATTIRGRFLVRKIEVEDGDKLSVALAMRSNYYKDNIELSPLSEKMMPKWSARIY